MVSDVSDDWGEALAMAASSDRGISDIAYGGLFVGLVVLAVLSALCLCPCCWLFFARNKSSADPAATTTKKRGRVKTSSGVTAFPDDKEDEETCIDEAQSARSQPQPQRSPQAYPQPPSSGDDTPRGETASSEPPKKETFLSRLLGSGSSESKQDRKGELCTLGSRENTYNHTWWVGRLLA